MHAEGRSGCPRLTCCCCAAAEGGFLAINEFLQSAGGPAEVFAAGDVATSVRDPRPKAGVFAVRQGPPLALNLRRFLTGQPLVPFAPQSKFLGLISAGEKHAIATRGSVAFSGDWLWQWKDRLDRSFMHQFGAGLPSMADHPGELPTTLAWYTACTGFFHAGRRTLPCVASCVAPAVPCAVRCSSTAGGCT